MELRIFSDPHKHVAYKGAEITGLVCAVSPASGIRPCLLYTSDAADDWLVV